MLAVWPNIAHCDSVTVPPIMRMLQERNTKTDLSAPFIATSRMSPLDLLPIEAATVNRLPISS